MRLVISNQVVFLDERNIVGVSNPNYGWSCSKKVIETTLLYGMVTLSKHVSKLTNFKL
jgi:hypothetical protein